MSDNTKHKQRRRPRNSAKEPRCHFIERPFVEIDSSPGFHVKIMTYNFLAQALIRRELFPTSGSALKWYKRSKTLLREVTHYDPDILCVQELDYDLYTTFWEPEFSLLGYFSEYHRYPNKKHGVCIFYKTALFVCKHRDFLDYDQDTQDIVASTVTRNVGLLVALEFTPLALGLYPCQRSGVIIGTTHLYWHPLGSFERARQTYIILKKTQQFINKLDNQWYTFFAGDFNTQPSDYPYLAITAKPYRTHENMDQKLLYSLAYHEYLGGLNADARRAVESGSPPNIVPTESQVNVYKELQSLHDKLHMRAISLYSVGYEKVDPLNVGRDNTRCEPLYSNWAHTFRALLDYIFLITEWDTPGFPPTDPRISEVQLVDLLDDLRTHQGMTLCKLLRLPRGEEMGPEPSGQPRIGQYPSDHFCLMAEVSFQ